MTEGEWLAGTDPRPMLEFLVERGSHRKLRLFACACCRRVWDRLEDRSLRAAVEVSEKFADGSAAAEELAQASEAAWEVKYRLEVEEEGESGEQAAKADIAFCAAEAVAQASCGSGGDGALYVDRAIDTASNVAEVAGYELAQASWAKGRPHHSEQWRLTWHSGRQAEQRAEANLLRDIFGDPFRPVALDPSWSAWNDGAVVKLARVIYDKRDFADLPLLGDALEEAGCTNTEILAHCRSTEGHICGCWVVDLILGKE